jgi:hypothetical protein
MSLAILFVLLFCIGVYWVVTQVVPERQKLSLLRLGLAEGLLTKLNEQRHERGLPLLEPDDDLMFVAENKAMHQITTGVSEEGWEYPESYNGMFGRSLLMETLLMGSSTTIGEKLMKQRDIFDGEWVRCGMGVAGGGSGQVVVTLILCREAWEPMAEMAKQRGLLERLVIGK